MTATCNAAKAQYGQESVYTDTLSGVAGSVVDTCNQAAQLPFTGFGGFLGLIILAAFLIALGLLVRRVTQSLDA